MEGLFRVPGPAAYTEDLIKGFEEGVLTARPLFARSYDNICIPIRT